MNFQNDNLLAQIFDFFQLILLMTIGIALVECRRRPFGKFSFQIRPWHKHSLGKRSIDESGNYRAEDVPAAEENPMSFSLGDIEIAPCGSGYCINMKPPSDQSAAGATE